MKVYAVIGGINCEGEDFDTLKLFDCKSTAELYKEKLSGDYDYALMDVREVSIDSSIIDDPKGYQVA